MRGWHGESKRHSLAAKGVATGSLSSYNPHILHEEYRPHGEELYLPISESTIPLRDRISDQESNIRISLKREREIPKIKIGDAGDVADLVGNMQDYDREFFKVIYLDTKNRVIGIETISRGSIDANIVHPRELFKGAILANATSILLVHNHPSGIPEPSEDDIKISSEINEVGKVVRMRVLDHIIIGKEGYTSLKSKGLF